MSRPSPHGFSGEGPLASHGFSARAIGPGAVLGMLGGGQLGRMFAIAARDALLI